MATRVRPLLPIALLLGLALCAPRAMAGDAPLGLELLDAGIRGQHRPHRNPETCFSLGISNHGHEEFTGQVVASALRDSTEGRRRFQKSVALSLSGTASRLVCLSLPKALLGRRDGAHDDVLFELRDQTGQVRASLTADLGQVLHAMGDGLWIGVLAGNASDLKQVQDAILFRDDGSRDLFSQAPMSFVFLGTTTPPCEQAFAELDHLVLALPVAKLSSAQTGAIERALLLGIALTIVDSYEGNAGFFPAEGAAAKAFGHGSVRHVANAVDPTALRHIKAPEPGVRLERRALRPEDLFSESEWAWGWFTPLPLPTRPWIAIVALVYLLLIGPINFRALARRDRRELAWLTTPLIALGCSAVIAPLLLSYRPDKLTLDTVTVRGTNGGDPFATMEARAYITSPRAAGFDFRLSADWDILSLERNHDPPDQDWTSPGVTLPRLDTPEWSRLMLGASGWTRATPPVSFSAEAIHNELDVRFTETLWIDGSNVIAGPALEPGGTWKPADAERRMPLAAVLSTNLRRAFPERRPPLWAMLSSTEPETVLQLLDGRAIFVGLTATAGVGTALEPAPELRHDYSIYIHGFPTSGEGAHAH